MPGASGLPAGIITCVFTDIEGSTRLLRELGSAFDEVLARHDAALREVWRAHGGHEIKTIGDAFMVVFADAGDAVAAAVDAQRAIAAVDWPVPQPIRVRVGMHTGYGRPTGDDYTALVVNQAARVVGCARGGQVLFTSETVAAFAAAPPDDVELFPLGRFKVRDFDEPVVLYTAAGPGVLAVKAPPRVRPADGHNLVRPTTSLVGREEEIAGLADLLVGGQVTTIVGPGGVGKTRLATETALEIVDRWDDGVWFVDLGPVGDASLVAAAVGEAVGAPVAPGAERWLEVLAHLAGKRALIVLDNCEHLTEASAVSVSELLSACPEVGVLATSRRPLGLRGERVHRLAPLATAGDESPAVALFLDRSGWRRPEDLEVVGALCAALDGLPLAIELAAARTAAVPPGEILRQLRRRPGALRLDDATLPERQRSLGRLLDWSWDLLSPDARLVLGRLSVFASGFDVEAAEVVGAGGAVALDDVAGLIWDLVDASLVRPEETAGATRYRLLATVRAHAASRADTDDLAAAVGRLAGLLLERVGPERATRHAWVVEMELELDNVRAVAGVVDDAAAAQALAWSIGRYHDDRDRYREGIEEIERLLDALPSPDPQRVALLTLLADLYLRTTDLDRVQHILEEAEALAEDVGAPAWDDGGTARTRGVLALRRDDPELAARVAREALTATWSDRGRARLHDVLGIALSVLGDYEGSAEAFENEVRHATTGGLETFLASTHTNLAETYLRLGDDERTAQHQAAALGLARERNKPLFVAFSMMIAARLVAARDRPFEAVLLQTRADDLLREASYALYADDERVRAKLLDDAQAALGRDDYHRAVRDGQALSLDAAANLAEQVLTNVGSSSNV